MPSSLFYKYYDTLFANKDYAGEVAAVFDYCREQALQPLRRVLELGCGTGNHTLELARDAGIHVTAVDTDQAMLARAEEKVAAAGRTNVTFAASCQVASNEDLCVALFNVVNYLLTERELERFFAGVAANLRPAGLLLFDCWNGDAAMKDPPGSKSYERQIGGKKLSCHLSCQTDIVSQITCLNYDLQLMAEKGELIESEKHSIGHRLWTPAQMKAAVEEAGLELLSLCVPFKFAVTASDNDWKIMFTCRKP